MIITNVSEFTVVGKRYPFTTFTWIFDFDKIDENMSPIAPYPPIPENTICLTFSKFIVS